MSSICRQVAGVRSVRSFLCVHVLENYRSTYVEDSERFHKQSRRIVGNCTTTLIFDLFRKMKALNWHHCASIPTQAQTFSKSSKRNLQQESNSTKNRESNFRKQLYGVCFERITCIRAESTGSNDFGIAGRFRGPHVSRTLTNVRINLKYIRDKSAETQIEGLSQVLFQNTPYPE